MCNLANSVSASRTFWFTTKRTKYKKGLDFSDFCFSFLVLKLFYFVIFVSFAVDTSPQETRKSLRIRKGSSL